MTCPLEWKPRAINPYTGLSQNEVQKLLQQYGPNSIPEQKIRTWVVFLKKMWAPVPWMLEASVVLELILGKYIEAGIIGALVVFNALMSTLQENRAQNALALLKKRLTVTSRVLRDGKWQMIPGSELVPGDIVYLRMGDLVPADVDLVAGQLLLDQSTLTGESMPVDAEKGAAGYAGTTVVRGEATGKVTKTGIHTRFGKTAELVRQAKTTGQLERIVFSIARNLVILDAILVGIVLIYALISGLPMTRFAAFRFDPAGRLSSGRFAGHLYRGNCPGRIGPGQKWRSGYPLERHRRSRLHASAVHG